MLGYGWKGLTLLHSKGLIWKGFALQFSESLFDRSNRGGRRIQDAGIGEWSTDLDGVVVAVVGEAEGAERAVDAVEAVHVALALVRVGVHPALHEEARRQQRL